MIGAQLCKKIKFNITTKLCIWSRVPKQLCQLSGLQLISSELTQFMRQLNGGPAVNF